MLEFIASIESSVRGYVRSFPTVFSTASGAWLTNSEGRRYLDFFAGAGALNYGHNPRCVKDALLDYIASDGILHSLDMATEAKVAFLRSFDSIILKPRGLDYRVQFTGPTGTNAVEAAIKLARKVTRRSHIVAFTNAYHGHSLGALALTGNRYYHDECYGSHNNVTHLPFDGYLGATDTSQLLEKLLDDRSSGLPMPAAVIVETIQGEGGIRVASTAWLQNLQRICAHHKILLIIDDIQVGNGRSGTFFSFEPAGIKPSMVCLSKSIGGGLPMSLVLIQPQFDQWQPGQHTGTFRGNNLAFVAGKAVLEYWKDNRLGEHVQSLSKWTEACLRGIVERYGDDTWSVRGRGMVWGLDVVSGAVAKCITARAFELGLIIETSGADDHVVKLLPPLTITDDELSLGLKLLEQAVREVVSEPPAMPPVAKIVTPISVPGCGYVNS
ncbi:MAG: diaminobutyrate--2-oxoglutarate transaminase [Pirellulaceae bacterium]|nr:diaminobutyrate--2-oxoglutarate transaminase [Pirellulaceae bacterium]